MIEYHLLDTLPERCFSLLTVSGTEPPPVGVGFAAGFADGYSLCDLRVIAHCDNGKFIAQQSGHEVCVRHLGIICYDTDRILAIIRATSREKSRNDSRLRIAKISLMMVQELRRAEQKHPQWTSDAVHAAGILAEESGEAMQAAVDFNATGDHDHLVCLEAETVQTGAMCLRLLLNLDEFRRPIDVRSVQDILNDLALDDDEKLSEIQKLIKG